MRAGVRWGVRGAGIQPGVFLFHVELCGPRRAEAGESRPGDVSCLRTGCYHGGRGGVL